ncbi:TIGR03943 family protein [Cohnella endophytica]|uniref:TIGR03943 family protein n=1 Tax=Cohnella endophytica TaxID=2419778 RepID=A0A494XTT3_9BACL|nr:TIGR03943 family protein [Cohnella endophytica]RKP53998.1 TIGR03943 family protein [Cohnella endophytica]
MKKIGIADVHNFLRAIILLGFASLIGYLVLTGDILLYVTPKLTIYLKIAGIGLLVVSLFQFYISFISLKREVIVCNCGHDHDHDHGHGHEDDDHHSHEPSRSLWKNVLIYGMFLLPLLLGSLLPNKALAGSLANQRGMNLGGVSVNGGSAPAELVELEGNEDPAIRSLFKTEPYNKDYAKLGMVLYQQNVIEMKDEWFIEKLQAMNTFADNFKGKTIKITGFVYREDGMPESQFIIGRMAMTHCIADISPYGIIVDSPDASQFENDSWITVTGTIDSTTFHELKVIKIDVDQIEPAHVSNVPYVYPDWNFASKL